MKKYYYDLHIHSALSPCADNDMTPNNIMAMARYNGLNIIAISDHNSVRNVEAALKLEKKYGVKVVPAMELQTAEDIHFLCLFPDFGALKRFYDGINFIDIKNDGAIFGDQLVIDENDAVVGEEPRLLLASSDMPSYLLKDAAASLGGIAVPAHIDRESNGILSILGGLDRDYEALEFSNLAKPSFREAEGRGREILINTDAHTLGGIGEAVNFLELNECTAKDAIAYLKRRRAF